MSGLPPVQWVLSSHGTGGPDATETVGEQYDVSTRELAAHPDPDALERLCARLGSRLAATGWLGVSWTTEHDRVQNVVHISLTGWRRPPRAPRPAVELDAVATPWWRRDLFIWAAAIASAVVLQEAIDLLQSL